MGGRDTGHWVRADRNRYNDLVRNLWIALCRVGMVIVVMGGSRIAGGGTRRTDEAGRLRTCIIRCHGGDWHV